MKKIPKKLFDAFVEESRLLMETGIGNHKRFLIAGELEKATGIGHPWFAQLVDSLIAGNGFLFDAENDEIYSVLRICGWEVVDDGK